MVNYVVGFILIYLAYRFIVGFILPLISVSQRVRQGMRDMNEDNFGANDKVNSTFKKPSQADKSTKPPAKDYIDFEEVKN